MKNKTIWKLVLYLIGIVLFIFVNQWASDYTTNLAKEDFKIFNSTAINGVLIEKGIMHHTISFKVNNNLQEFAFYPNVAVGTWRDFSYFLEIGDSIIKPAQSDTLFLIKAHKSYKYTFDKR